MIELRDAQARVLAEIPAALIHEAIKALPDASEAREKLIQWTRLERPTAVSLTEIRSLEHQLAEFAHENRSELGIVGRLPPDAAGRIVDTERFDSAPISATVVLALAIRRFVLLCGLGVQIVVEPKAGEEAA